MDFIHFICWEDAMGWLGRVPRLGLVMSEEEFLLGQVSLAFIGMEQCFIRVFSLDMTLLGWARIWK